MNITEIFALVTAIAAFASSIPVAPRWPKWLDCITAAVAGAVIARVLSNAL